MTLKEQVAEITGVDISRKIRPGHSHAISLFCYNAGQSGDMSERVILLSDVRSMIDSNLPKRVANRPTLAEICDRVEKLPEIIAAQGGELIRQKKML